MRRALAVVGLVVIAAGFAACGLFRPMGAGYQPVDRHFAVTLYTKHANQDRCDTHVSDPIRVVEGDTLYFDVINLCDGDQTVAVRWAGSNAGPNDAPSTDMPSSNVPANQSIVMLKAVIERDAADHTGNEKKPKTYHYNFSLTGQDGRDPDIVVDFAP